MEKRISTGMWRALLALVILMVSGFTVGVQAQAVGAFRVTPTVSSQKAAPITNGTLNVLAGTASINMEFSLAVNVKEINEAYYIFNGTRYNIDYTVDEQGHKAVFESSTIELNNVGTYDAITAYVQYMDYYEEPQYFQQLPKTVSATTPYSIRVWPRGEVSYESSGDGWGVYSNANVLFSVNVYGGNDSGWRYNWSTGATTSTTTVNMTNTTDNVLTENTNVTVRNIAPDGTSVWEEFTHTFNTPVYPTASAAKNVQSGDNVYSGTVVNLSVASKGGNPDGWSYSWQDVTSSAGNSATVTTENTANSAIVINPTVQVVNESPDDMIWYNERFEFPITVWPEPQTGEIIHRDRTQFFNGETDQISVETSGGDPAGWTYVWSVDGNVVSGSGNTYTITYQNNGNSAVTRTIAVQAKNVIPDGASMTFQRQYEVIVYPTPGIVSVTPEATAYYVNDPVDISAVVEGGNPEGWVYEWKLDNGVLSGQTTNHLTGMQLTAGTHIFTFTATNEAGGESRILSQDIEITVWPTPSATLQLPERTEWINGESLAFYVSTNGGSSNWTYEWSIDGQTVPNTTSHYDYNAYNVGNAGAQHRVAVKVFNSPEGIKTPYETTQSFDFTVYPTPVISNVASSSTAIFSGNEVMVTGTVAGGNPNGWTYEWKRNGAVMTGNTSLSFSDAPTATGSTPETYTYHLTATNNYGGVSKNLSQDITVTVWPAPSVGMQSPARTEWINGESLLFEALPAGGDSDNWTYRWTVDGAEIANTATIYNYIAFCNSESGVNRTITMTATNTPDGIDKAFSETLTYECIVYPEPQIAQTAQDYPVIFSGTESTMNIVTAGGNSAGWTIQWKLDGNNVGDGNASLTVAPVNEGSGAVTQHYTVIATNTYGDASTVLTREFDLTIWPTAAATLVEAEFNEWYPGYNPRYSVDIAGGDPTAWTYTWEYENTTSDSQSFSFTTENNTDEAVVRTVKVVATNSPAGINEAYSITLTHDITIYSTPWIGFSLDNPVVFSGTESTMIVTPHGGSDNWIYQWTRNDIGLTNTLNSLLAKDENTGDGAVIYIYKVVATNSCASATKTLDHEYVITVWPKPAADLILPGYDKWINGQSVGFGTTTKGGDPTAWTYEWIVDGTSVTNTQSSFNYVAFNDQATAVKRDIKLIVRNTPQGINAPHEQALEYSCTVYPTPVIAAKQIDSEVVFNGTPVKMSITTAGGYPDGWTYWWTKEDQPIGEAITTLTDIPANDGTEARTYVYRAYAKNILNEYSFEDNSLFIVSVWPTPHSSFPTDLRDNVLSGNSDEIVVNYGGGDTNAWKFEWSVNGAEVQNGSSERYVFSQVNTTHEAQQYTVTVKVTNTPEDINKEYSETYTHTFTVWPAPSAEAVTDNYIVTCSRRTQTIGVNYYGGQDGEWQFSWTLNGQPLDVTANTQTVVFANETNEMRTDRYTVTAENIVNGNVEYSTTVEFTIDIYPQPLMSQGRADWNVYYDSTIVLQADHKYGYPLGWNFEWSESDMYGDSPSYNVLSDEADKYDKVITVTVTNGYGDVVWAREEFTYNIHAWSRGTVTNETFVNANYDGEMTGDLSAIVKGGYIPESGHEGGWTYKWTLNDGSDLISDESAMLTVKESNETNVVRDYVWRLVAENTLEGVVGCHEEITWVYSLWPRKHTPNEITVSANALRSGETLQVYALPAAQGGYQYTWNYYWTVGNQTVQNNSPEYTTQVVCNEPQMDYTDYDISLRLVNPGPENDYWFNYTYPSKTVRVYSAPVTPSELVRKGNGTTHTVIAMCDGLTDAQLSAAEYQFVFGYTDAAGHDNIMPAITERYMQFAQSIFDNTANDFWVYTQWNYKDGSVVTSRRRHLSGQVDNFNGSQFIANGRGDAAGIEGVVDDSGIYLDSNGFILRLDSPTDVDVRIVNMSGAVVFTKEYHNAGGNVVETFGNGRLLSGMYIVWVKTGNEEKVKKVVIK